MALATRSFILGLAACTLGVGCGGGSSSTKPAKPAPTPASPARSKPEPTAKADALIKVYDACIGKANKQDVEGIVACFTKDGTSAMVDGSRDAGRAAIRESMTKLWKGVPDMTRHAQVLLVAADARTTATIFLEKATHKGKIGPIAATNKPIGFWGVQLVNWTDERLISGNVHFFDQATVLAQLGVIKMPHRPVATALWGKPVVVKATGSAREKQNLASVDALLAGVKARSADTMFAGFHDDIVFHNLGGPGDIRGGANVRKFFTLLMTAFPDLKREHRTAFAAGDWVFVHARWLGTNTGPSDVLGIAQPTQQPLTYHAAEFYRFEGGKVKEMWSFNDRITIINQLNLFNRKQPSNKPATPAK